MDKPAAFARFLSDGHGAAPSDPKHKTRFISELIVQHRGPSTEFPLSGHGSAADVGTLQSSAFICWQKKRLWSRHALKGKGKGELTH